jgi:hypothetical protein
MFWSVIAGFFAVALALAALVGLVQSLKRIRGTDGSWI